MDEQGYNGWKNYETWTVYTWLANDEFTEQYLRTLAQNENGAEKIRDWAASKFQVVTGNSVTSRMGYNLLAAAYSMVDWRAIWSAFLS